MSSFIGKTFVLELGREIRFKVKKELINYIREQNAHVSFILTASTDYVLVSDDIDTFKTRRAKQLGIPLVNVEYIYECRKSRNENVPVDVKKYIITSAEDKENFSKSGTLPVSGGTNPSCSIAKSIKLDLLKIKIWNSDDAGLPKFDELAHTEIGKWAIFKETNDKSDVYFALELQIIPDEYYNSTHKEYRSRFRYEKQIITADLQGQSTSIQYAFSNDVNELHQLFASYYNRISTMPRTSKIRDFLPDKLGSKLLLRSLFLHRIDTQILDDSVCQLVESLWMESIGDFNKILSIRPETIPLKTIIEAETALLEIKSDSKAASQAEAQFYSLIPHQPSFIVDLVNDRRALIEKLDLCQMLQDLVTVNELTNWNVKASVEAKYRALKCHIETIKNDTHEYMTISNMISSSANNDEQVVVHQIYSIAKQTDSLNFRSTLFNQKQLFHGSKYNNYLGILSRGLLLPKVVMNDLGVTRTDIGCLGYGLYFSESVSTSLKYTTPSSIRAGRRLLCISQVALGESAKFYSYAPDLVRPPDNFHSTHGVKRNNTNNSKFLDDEYAIYNLDQQRLLYLVEISWKPYDTIDSRPEQLNVIRNQLTNLSTLLPNEVDIPVVMDEEIIQVAEQDYGLICPSSGQSIPLKAFHIRAQLVDVISEVVLYQVYHNTSSAPIEAKYVFPLDENCSVCGFEAHINNKIIKGIVKEKEKAKREYREAIEKGHGAYLMDQEQPEIFSVRVGNLPANCEVVIKITYVTELAIENNDIMFRIPAKVASWQAKQALDTKYQTVLPSINLEQDNSSMKSVEFSLKTSIRMPYEIVKLFSPTHRLRRKVTDCMAMIELLDNILLEKDFILSITLRSINLPRMLNETYLTVDSTVNDSSTDESSQACMLTFYPKFDMTNNQDEYVEIIFIIDVSNSMDGKYVQQAKQLAHLFLTNMKTDDKNIFFNIVTFGSDNEECFPISFQNTKENIDKAKHFVLHSLVHRGNTDLFSVFRQYTLLPSIYKLGRQFILLSDGHINDLKSILALLGNQSSLYHDRLFTCSIGDTANKHNLRQLVHAANGGGLMTVFDSNYRSRWKTKVLQILEYVRQPCVTNVSISWHGTVDEQKELFSSQAPRMIRSLFNGARLTVYRFIKNCHKATLTVTINDQEYVTTVFSNRTTEICGRTLHCLTTRAIIQDYENGLLDNDECVNELLKRQYKQDLIDLSMKYSIVSPFTSFVAIEERDDKELEQGVRLLDIMLEEDFDLLPYMGWDGERSKIHIIKQQLIDAKRTFDSASKLDKMNLVGEYIQLCDSISYRFGGDAKYELMLTIIDAYPKTIKGNDLVRGLEDRMRNDLILEMNSATVEERKILERKLHEVTSRIDVTILEDLEASTEKRKSEGDGWIDKNVSCITQLGIDHTIQNEDSDYSGGGGGTSGYSDEDHDKEDKSCRITGDARYSTEIDGIYSNGIAFNVSGEDDRNEYRIVDFVIKHPAEIKDTFRLHHDITHPQSERAAQRFCDQWSSNIEASKLEAKSSPSPELLEDFALRFCCNNNQNQDFVFDTPSKQSSIPVLLSGVPLPESSNIESQPFSFGSSDTNNNNNNHRFALHPSSFTDSFNASFCPFEYTHQSRAITTDLPVTSGKYIPKPPTCLPTATRGFRPVPPSSPSLPQSMISDMQRRQVTSLFCRQRAPPPLLPTGTATAVPRWPISPEFNLASQHALNQFDIVPPPSTLQQPLAYAMEQQPAFPFTAAHSFTQLASAESDCQARHMTQPLGPESRLPPPTFLNEKTDVHIANQLSPFLLLSEDSTYSSNVADHSLLRKQPCMKHSKHTVCEPQNESMSVHGASILHMDQFSKNSSFADVDHLHLFAQEPDYVPQYASSNTKDIDIRRNETICSTEPSLYRLSNKYCEKIIPPTYRLTKGINTKDAKALEDMNTLRSVMPFSVGIEDDDGHMYVMISRGQMTPMQTQYPTIFTNAFAYQTTAIVRIFQGEHVLTKYNTYIGEFALNGLSSNFASQTVEISVSMSIDEHHLLVVDAIDSQSGATASFSIMLSIVTHEASNLIQSIPSVKSHADDHAAHVNHRYMNSSVRKLKGETIKLTINFTHDSNVFQGFPELNTLKPISLISTVIREIKRIQLADGSFDLNNDLAKLLSMNMNEFDGLKIYFNKQGFNSFASNTQTEIIHLIATGIVLIHMLLQVPVSERTALLVPFDEERIQSILHRHLPRILLININQAIEFYGQKRHTCDIYCNQLELTYSSWEKYIEHGLFHLDD